jgi:hypothetical protein
MQQQPNSSKTFFFLGSAISSIGSFTMMLTLAATLAKQNNGLFLVGLCFGLGRFARLVANFFLGPWVQKLNYKFFLVRSEFAGFVFSILVLTLYKPFLSKNSLLLVVLITLRTSFISLQQLARAPIVKVFHANTFDDQTKGAVLLNLASSGSVGVAAIVSFFLLKYCSFSVALGIDAATFLVCTVFFWRYLPNFENILQNTEVAPSSRIYNLVIGFQELKSSTGLYYWKGILCTLIFAGSNVYSAKVLINHEELIPLVTLINCICVYLSSGIARSKYFKSLELLLWLILSIGWFVITLSPSDKGIFFLSMFLMCLSFWSIQNYTSGLIQYRTKKHLLGSTIGAQDSQESMLMSAGEIVHGSFASSINLVLDCASRVVLAICGFSLSLMRPSNKK